jgi:hypothetical protein
MFIVKELILSSYHMSRTLCPKVNRRLFVKRFFKCELIIELISTVFSRMQRSPVQIKINGASGILTFESATVQPMRAHIRRIIHPFSKLVLQIAGEESKAYFTV